MKDFARGCMRTYLILKEKARQWNADAEIQALVQEVHADDGATAQYGRRLQRRPRRPRSRPRRGPRGARRDAASPTSGWTS